MGVRGFLSEGLCRRTEDRPGVPWTPVPTSRTGAQNLSDSDRAGLGAQETASLLVEQDRFGPWPGPKVLLRYERTGTGSPRLAGRTKVPWGATDETGLWVEGGNLVRATEGPHHPHRPGGNLLRPTKRRDRLSV